MIVMKVMNVFKKSYEIKYENQKFIFFNDEGGGQKTPPQSPQSSL